MRGRIVDLELLANIELSVTDPIGIDVVDGIGVIGVANPAGEIGEARAVLRRECLDVEPVAEGLALGSDLQPAQIKDRGWPGSIQRLKVDTADLKADDLAGVEVLMRGLVGVGGLVLISGNVCAL